MKKRLDQHGFSAVIIILLVIIVAGVGFTGWYVYNSNNKTNTVLNDTTKTTNPTPTPTSTKLPSNIIDYTTAKIGDQYGALTISSVGPYNAEYSDISLNNLKMVFSGKAEVEGSYSYINTLVGGFELIFTVKNTSQSQLPYVENGEYLSGERIDTNSRFTLYGGNYDYNDQELLNAFGITKEVEKSGTAKIVIENYVISNYPSEVFNLATLSSILELN